MNHIPRIKWHDLNDGGHIAKVIGGWLYRFDTWNTVNLPELRNEGSMSSSVTTSDMVFISDPTHEWAKVQNLEDLISGRTQSSNNSSDDQSPG